MDHAMAHTMDALDVVDATEAMDALKPMDAEDPMDAMGGLGYLFGFQAYRYRVSWPQKPPS